MRFLTFLIFAALASLNACAPAAETYSYTLPPTAGGRMCSHQCLEAQDYCRQTCSLQERRCVNEVQARALQDYDQYTRQQFFSHEAIDLTPSDFERQKPCKETRTSCSALCDNHYNVCYQDCGGQVDVSSSCQFLCF